MRTHYRKLEPGETLCRGDIRSLNKGTPNESDKGCEVIIHSNEGKLCGADRWHRPVPDAFRGRVLGTDPAPTEEDTDREGYVMGLHCGLGSIGWRKPTSLKPGDVWFPLGWHGELHHNSAYDLYRLLYRFGLLHVPQREEPPVEEEEEEESKRDIREAVERIETELEEIRSRL